MSVARLSYIFFFQAEDGIRDLTVTGVQTCALPIYVEAHHTPHQRERDGRQDEERAAQRAEGMEQDGEDERDRHRNDDGEARHGAPLEIGRAACRGRVEISVVAGSFKKKKNK